MEGRLCGHVESTTHKPIEGCWLVAIYRLNFNAGDSGGGGEITAIIEGLSPAFRNRLLAYA